MHYTIFFTSEYQIVSRKKPQSIYLHTHIFLLYIFFLFTVAHNHDASIFSTFKA